MALGVECAERFGDSQFDSCHLLSGAHREGRGVAHAVLNSFGITQMQIDNAIDVRRGTVRNESFEINDDICIVLSVAFTAADKMAHKFIGTEHLLVGMTADGTNSAALLTDLGLAPVEVTVDVFNLLGHDDIDV